MRMTDLGAMFGRSRSSVIRAANAMKLVKIPDDE